MYKKITLLAITLVIFSFFTGPLFVAGVQAAPPEKVKMGLMFGLTGAASPIGPVQLDGAKLAIKEINAAGGVKFGAKKAPIEVFVKDDESKPDIAIRRYREMVDENKVDVIVGQTFAPISAALNKEVKKSSVAYFPVNVVAINMFEKNEMAETTFPSMDAHTPSVMPGLHTLSISWATKKSFSSVRRMLSGVTSGRVPKRPLKKEALRLNMWNHRLEPPTTLLI